MLGEFIAGALYISAVVLGMLLEVRGCWKENRF